MLQWTTASERRFTRLGALNDARVLVAHPYHAARRAVRAVLEPLGCTVTEDGTPAEGLELARRRRAPRPPPPGEGAGGECGPGAAGLHRDRGRPPGRGPRAGAAPAAARPAARRR